LESKISLEKINFDWIGHIPSDWELKKFKFIFKEKKSTKNVLLNSGSISFGEVIYKNDDKITELTKSSYQEVLNGEFLINPLNLNFDLKSLRIGLSKINVVVSQGYIVLKINKGFCPNYYKYLLRKFDVEYMKSLGQGVRQTISFNDIKNEYLVVPNFNEQEIISKFLDNKTEKIDLLVEKIEKKIELLKEQKTVLINKYVTKGLDPNVEMKDSGIKWIGEIPKHWKLSKIKWITKKIGSGITPRGGSQIYTKEGVKLLRSQNIHFDGLHLENVVYINKDIDESMSNSRTKKNDVLFNITGGSIGRCCLINNDETMNVNQHVCIIRPNKKEIDPYYLLSFLCSDLGQIQLRLNLTGSGREGINFENLGNFIIPLPEMDEQKKIGNHISKFNHKEFLLLKKFESKISLLQEYRHALISSVVTGKIRITEDML